MHLPFRIFGREVRLNNITLLVVMDRSQRAPPCCTSQREQPHWGFGLGPVRNPLNGQACCLARISTLSVTTPTVGTPSEHIIDFMIHRNMESPGRIRAAPNTTVMRQRSLLKRCVGWVYHSRPLSCHLVTLVLLRVVDYT